MIHCLKIEPHYLDSVINGNKTFEIRKNDRYFQEKDILVLQEYDKEKQRYLDRAVTVIVTYVLDDFFEGLKDGYAVLGIKKIQTPKVHKIPIEKKQLILIAKLKNIYIHRDKTEDICEGDLIIFEDSQRCENPQTDTLELTTEVEYVFDPLLGYCSHVINPDKNVISLKVLKNII